MSDDPGGWAAWTAAERESFFDAIARHRRASWRVTLASRIGNLVVSIIVAVLMAPLFYAVVALVLDLLNLLVAVPNIIPGIHDHLEKAFDAPGKTSVSAWATIALLAAAPGLVWMAFVLNGLRAVLRSCVTLDAGELNARAPNPTVLAEQRFTNVVQEMSIAAGIPPPRAYIADSDVVDAAAVGVDEKNASIIISAGLLSRLDRAQMEGVAADLVASVANGDMTIGLRAALSVSLFGLIARLASVITQKNARRGVAKIGRALLLPTGAAARKLVVDLGNPFKHDEDAETAAEEPATAPPTQPQGGLIGNIQERWQKIRPYLWLPLGGPLVMTGFFAGIVNLFILGPLLSLAWRQRKYMADATAVRLTRDPDTLAGALEKIDGCGGTPLAPWAAHMSIVSQGVRQRGMFGSSAVPMFPSIDSRLRALGTMGAHLARPPRKIPLRIILIAVPLFGLVAVLVAIMLPLMVWLSLAMTMLFGGIPFGIVHMLLRSLGHH